MKRYIIIDRQREIKNETDNVCDVIEYLRNYKDIDFRDWSSITDDRLSYIDGIKNLSITLEKSKGGTPFDWSYGSYTNKIVINTLRELNLEELLKNQ
jgi:hypothetical protein